MVSKITSLELDVRKFPHIISAFSNKSIVKKWEFTNIEEAKEAQNEIWNEILKAKLGEKNEIKKISG